MLAAKQVRCTKTVSHREGRYSREDNEEGLFPPVFSNTTWIISLIATEENEEPRNGNSSNHCGHLKFKITFLLVII